MLEEQDYAAETKTLLQVPDGSRVDYVSSPTEGDKEALWAVVQAGFIDLNRKSYEKQDMTREEFDADMSAPNVLKYIAYDADNTPIGCLMAHVGLDDVTWVNRDMIEGVQRNEDMPARPYYVSTVVVPPDLQGAGVATHILQATLIHVRNDLPNALCFFDCADANHPWLADFIRKSGEPSEEDGFPGMDMDVKEIGVEYWVKNDNDASVTKMHDLPEEAEGLHVLDKQHYYAVRFLQ